MSGSAVELDATASASDGADVVPDAMIAAPEAPILPRARLVGWFAERPRIADVLVIVACVAPTVAALVFSPPAQLWLGCLCAAGVAIALWWRRSHPLVVLLVTVALASLNPVGQQGTSTAFFEALFGFYAVAAYTRLRVAVLGLALAEAVALAVAGLTILLGLRTEWPFLVLEPISLAAFALGLAVRASRARREATLELVSEREERAAAAERARITAEMHDVVAHSVTVMVALAGGASAGWEKHPERARDALDQLGTVGAQTLEDMQRILRVLREGDGDLDRDLESSGHNAQPLDEVVGVFRAAGLPVRLVAPPDREILDPALRTSVSRIVREALTNALRYSRDPTLVEVEVRLEPDRVVVTVQDDGRGGPPGPSVGAGLGLRAMRERVAAFHGEFEAGPLSTGGDPTLAGEGSRSEGGGSRPGWRVRVALPATRWGA